jgi:hypothetical protein
LLLVKVGSFVINQLSMAAAVLPALRPVQTWAPAAVATLEFFQEPEPQHQY